MNTIALEPAPSRVATSPIRLLLLALGNELLSDDGVGLYVAREVRRLLSEVAGLEICEVSEMGLSLLDHMAGFDEMILIDAVQTGRALPGHLHEFDSTQLAVLSTRTPHRLGLGEVLALGEQLGLAIPRRVRVLAIEVEDPFTVGTEMTLGLRQAVPRLVQQVINVIMHAVQTATRSG